MSSRTYLVPHDFSSVGDTATLQAIKLAQKSNGEVHILHIIKKSSEEATAAEKIKEIVSRLRPQENSPKFTYSIKKGNIFKDISSVAAAKKASLIIMGTHGIVGMQQKMFGSFAAKVIQSSDVPFLIVQDGNISDKFDSIIMPVDMTAQSIQVLSAAIRIALIFDSEMTILGIKSKDAIFARKISTHITVVKKQMQKYNVKGKVVLFPDTGGFKEKVMDYGKEIGTDVFAIAYNSGNSLIPKLDQFAQSFITNPQKTPTLIINSKDVTSGYF